MRRTSTSGTKPTDGPGPGRETETLLTAASTLGLALTPFQVGLLARYADLVRDWNRRVNLVSRRDADRILEYHVVDSLASARLCEPGSRVADIGTGAGLPGIPLAIARPDLSVVLVESSGNRCRFLWHAPVSYTHLTLPTN